MVHWAIRLVGLERLSAVLKSIALPRRWAGDEGTVVWGVPVRFYVRMGIVRRSDRISHWGGRPRTGTCSIVLEFRVIHDKRNNLAVEGG